MQRCIQSMYLDSRYTISPSCTPSIVNRVTDLDLYLQIADLEFYLVKDLSIVDAHHTASDNSCHRDTSLTVVPELRGVLQLPELHARYATGINAFVDLHALCL